MKFRKTIVSILLLFLCISLISTVYSQDCSGNSHKISSSLSNDEIQNIIDNAVDGDKIIFNENNYNNISLIINKKLNIESPVNSQIKTSNTISSKASELGLNNTFGFYFTNTSSGSTLSGLNFLTNSDCGIIVYGASNISIKSNNFSHSLLNGILIDDSSNTQIINNFISNSAKNGLLIKDSNGFIVKENNISDNIKSGIHLSNAYNGIVDNNTIFRNDFNGISLYDVSNNLNITHNLIYQNSNGVYINSEINNVNIVANTLIDNRIDPSSELGAFETGNGVLIGEDYTKKGSQPNVEYNTISNNERFGVKNNPNFETMSVGPNWYATNDPSQSFVCPMILGRILTASLDINDKGISVGFLDNGKQVPDLGTFEVQVTIGGNEYTASVIDGKAFIDTDLEPNSEYSYEANIGGYVVKDKVKIKEPVKNETEEVEENFQNETEEIEEHIPEYNDNTQAIDNPNMETLNPNNLTDTLYSTNNTENKKQTNSEVGESSDLENANPNDVKTSKSYELKENKPTKAVSNNNTILIIIAITVLFIIFIIGYLHKDN